MFLSNFRKFPDHFEEGSLFTGGLDSKKLKHEFKHHFRNISRIMDCVGCDKCRLWGKLQVSQVIVVIFFILEIIDILITEKRRKRLFILPMSIFSSF